MFQDLVNSIERGVEDIQNAEYCYEIKERLDYISERYEYYKYWFTLNNEDEIVSSYNSYLYN